MFFKTFVIARADIFGEQSFYVGFENDNAEDTNAGLNSLILFGRIVYKTQNEALMSKQIVVKTVPTFLFQSDFFVVQFVNEILFYSRILPFFKSLKIDVEDIFPKFYDSQLRMNADTVDVALLFEDLRHEGYILSKRRSFLDYEHLTLMMRKIGQFHGYSYSAKKKNFVRFYSLGKAFLPAHFTVLGKLRNLLTMSGTRAITALKKDPQYVSKLSNIERIIERADDFMVQILTMEAHESISVLCHGDYLVTNLMFQYDENGKPVNIKLIDMASCVVGSPIIDIGFVLYFHANQKMRDDHWNDLIEQYYVGLLETCLENEAPTKNCIMNEFQTKSIYSYLIASYYLLWQLSYDNNFTTFYEMLPEKYREYSVEEIPETVTYDIYKKLGGTLGTEVLMDILKDMLQRNFI
ncbi:hypothetical protein PGB90_004784 [Kerria lacca]